MHEPRCQTFEHNEVCLSSKHSSRMMQQNNSKLITSIRHRKIGYTGMTLFCYLLMRATRRYPASLPPDRSAPPEKDINLGPCCFWRWKPNKSLSHAKLSVSATQKVLKPSINTPQLRLNALMRDNEKQHKRSFDEPVRVALTFAPRDVTFADQHPLAMTLETRAIISGKENYEQLFPPDLGLILVLLAELLFLKVLKPNLRQHHYPQFNISDQ